MAIKLKSLKLPSTPATWYSTATKSTKYNKDGQYIDEVYLQDSTGVLGGIRLGTEHNVWIPAKYVDQFFRGDKLEVGNQKYTIQDIKEYFYRDANGDITKPNSAFEAHYQLTITLPND
jgi:hypothetical protein